MGYTPSREIYESFKKGDAEAYNQIYKGLYKNAWYFVWSKLDDFKIDRAFEAEDIVSSVFIKLWIGREKMNDPAHIYQFVFTACRRELIDLRRTSQHRQEREDEVARMGDLFSDQLTFITPDILQVLMPYIDKLPNRRKTVLKMYLAGKSTVEIQDSTGLNKQTVLNHKTRAVDKLKSFKKMLLDY